MTTALTPAQALGLLGALHTDIAAAAVLDAAGAVLAGAPELTPGQPDAVTASDAQHAIVVATAPGALRDVLAIDLQTALQAMAPPR